MAQQLSLDHGNGTDNLGRGFVIQQIAKHEAA